MEKKYKKLFFSRVFMSIVFILIQVTWMLLLFMQFYQPNKYLEAIIRILSIIYIIYIINKKNEKLEYKAIWIIMVLIFPVFGVPYYMLYGDKRPGRRFKRRLDNADEKFRKYYSQDMRILDEMAEEKRRSSLTSRYILNDGNYPVFKNTRVDYYSSGEALYEAMIEELKKAEKFIFIEYFTIEISTFWNSILEILKKKADEGVEVRIMYDDFGSIAYLPKRYPKELEKLSPNIHAIKFNRVVPFFSPFMNNRDHRKILVIDGNVAFTGGINLSDRYININSPYGHWKDAGVRLIGDAVKSFVLMYMEMWEAIVPGTFEEESVKKYIGKFKYDTGAEGYVQPYGDEPFDSILLSENIYLEMIEQAEKYVYVYTPYLILSDELATAFCLAAKKGLDVRIVTPGIPDKKMIYRATRSNYPHLLSAGVRIYEYTPGFIHSKCLLIDGKRATVGTVNFDYRSLFLHFEDGVYYAENKAVTDLEKDMKETFRVCREVTLENTKKTIVGRLFDSLLEVVAPLL